MEEYLYQQFYEIENTHWWFTARRSILTTYLRRHVDTTQRWKLLDVGCGTGAILADASRFFDAHGMDASPHAIELCRKRGLSKLFVGNLNEYPGTETFDIITLFDVIEHIDDDLGVLKQAYSRLNSTGHVLVTVPAYQWLWSAHDEVNHHKRRYTRAQLRRVLTHAGFQIDHCTYFNTLLFPAALLRRLFAQATHARQADDFLIPPGPVNTLLRGIFRLERHVVPVATLPFGLSLLCWATKPHL
jgi:trans-aconitate methyltransferase